MGSKNPELVNGNVPVVFDVASSDSFGNVPVSEITPRAILAFNYNINTELVSTSTTGTGSVAHSGEFAVLSTSAAISSSAELSSNDTVDYLPGIGGMCRFTAVFSTGVAGSTQWIGIGADRDWETPQNLI